MVDQSEALRLHSELLAPSKVYSLAAKLVSLAAYWTNYVCQAACKGVAMRVLLSCLLVFCFWFCSAQGQQADPLKGKKGSPAENPLAKLDTDGFLKLFDKQKRGYVTKDELPPRLAPFFEQMDRDADGRLDRTEIEQMLQVVKARAKAEAKKQEKPESPKVPPQVRDIMDRMDTNKDGTISKSEAKGPILQNFERIDRNKDGFIDSRELAQFVRDSGGLGMRGKMGDGRFAPPTNPYDFDALDANADGRLTKEEIKKTPWADKFEEIDVNKDGKLSKKEWEAFLKKQKPGQ